MSHRPSRRTRTTVPLALAAGALVLSGAGGAVAGSMVTGVQIKNGTVTGTDVKNRSLSATELTPAAVKNLRGNRGPRGPQGLARAWARVDGDGDVAVQSGGVTVTRPAGVVAGRYCVEVAGIDPADTVLLASPYFTNNGTNTGDHLGQSFVEVGTNAGCAGGGVEVVTLVRTWTHENGALTDTNLKVVDQPFVVIVP